MAGCARPRNVAQRQAGTTRCPSLPVRQAAARRWFRGVAYSNSTPQSQPPSSSPRRMISMRRLRPEDASSRAVRRSFHRRLISRSAMAVNCCRVSTTPALARALVLPGERLLSQWRSPSCAEGSHDPEPAQEGQLHLHVRRARRGDGQGGLVTRCPRARTSRSSSSLRVGIRTSGFVSFRGRAAVRRGLRQRRRAV